MCVGCAGSLLVSDTAQVELRSGRVQAPGDRLTEGEEGDALLTSVRSMVAEEARALKLKGNNAAMARARLEKKQARLRKRRGEFREDNGGALHSFPSQFFWQLVCQ